MIVHPFNLSMKEAETVRVQARLVYVMSFERIRIRATL